MESEPDIGGPGGTSYVVQTSTAQVTLPFSNRFSYPPNGSGPNDLNGFQSAIFSGTLNVPTSEPLTFSIGEDDVAFVYVDGTIACNLGGARGYVLGCTTPNTLSAGSPPLQIFYSDLFATNAGLTFSVTTAGVTGTPGISATPAPPTTTPALPTILLAMVALVGLGLFTGYRRLQRPVTRSGATGSRQGTRSSAYNPEIREVDQACVKQYPRRVWRVTRANREYEVGALQPGVMTTVQ